MLLTYQRLDMSSGGRSSSLVTPLAARVGVSPHGAAPEKDARDAWARPRDGEHSRSFFLDQQPLPKSQEASGARGPQAGSPGGLSWLPASPDLHTPPATVSCFDCQSLSQNCVF